MAEACDVVLVGGGPAALSAAIYASRAQLKTLVLERMMLGGQVATTSSIDNYPGFPEGVDGPDLTARMEGQAKRYGTEFRTEEVTEVALDGEAKVVTWIKATSRPRITPEIPPA